MSLPNPNQDFSAFDVLTASSLDDMVENIEALQDGSAFDSTTDTSNLGGAWATWTPTLTGMTLGNGTKAGWARKVGKHTDFKLAITFGSTTTLPTGADNKVSAPFPINTNGQLQYYSTFGMGQLKVTTSGYVILPAYFDTNTLVLLGFGGNPNVTGALTTNNYGSPGAGSFLYAQGFYENT